MAGERIIWVECPRDAWQGLPRIIPIDQKRAHLRHLLAAGFERLDLGSFVSPAAVPQMADTEEVLRDLVRPLSADFLCIVGNRRGLERAGMASGVTSVGYPLALSDTFQRRNLGRSLDESWSLVATLAREAESLGIDLVVYLSMGFGNPYGDPWHPEITAQAVSRVRALGIERIALADTVGTADAQRIGEVLDAIGASDGSFDGPSAGTADGMGDGADHGAVQAKLGLHLHARPDAWQPLVSEALRHGVRWFEGALAGVGGCPFAGDELVGNLPTERVLRYLVARGLDVGVDLAHLDALRDEAALLATRYG